MWTNNFAEPRTTRFGSNIAYNIDEAPTGVFIRPILDFKSSFGPVDGSTWIDVNNVLGPVDTGTGGGGALGKCWWAFFSVVITIIFWRAIFLLLFNRQRKTWPGRSNRSSVTKLFVVHQLYYVHELWAKLDLKLPKKQKCKTWILLCFVFIYEKIGFQRRWNEKNSEVINIRALRIRTLSNLLLI